MTTKKIKKMLDMDNVISNLPGYVYWVDINNVYLGCNDYYALEMGLNSIQEIIGKKFSSLNKYIDTLSSANPNSANTEILKTGIASSSEEKILKKNGTIATVISHKIPLRDKSGEIKGLLNFSTDITEHKRKEDELQSKVEQSELALANIVANMPAHVYWKDRNGVYLGCNNRQANSLGLQYGYEVVGKTDFDLPWGNDIAKTFRENDLSVMNTGLTQTIEEPTNIGGNKAIMLSQKTPLKNKLGETMGILGISIDITKLKDTEEKLLAAKSEAEVANKLKTEFIHNIEHDIRTPLGGLWGLANMLAQQETDPEKKKLVVLMERCAKEVLEYHNSILDFAKTETGVLPLLEKKFNLKELIEKIVTIELPEAEIKHVEFLTEFSDDLPAIVIGDPQRVERILLNLTGNSFKFTQKGHVKIKAKVAKKTENKVIIQLIVEDTGIGISKQNQEHIYEKFTRVVPSNKGLYKGTGLGLHVVKQLIEDINGEIDVKSDEGKGTTFTCTIPFKLPLVDEVLSKD